MKKLFYLFALAAVIMGCSKEETIPTLGKYTLTGYSAVQTKTDFGTPGDGSIPFEWSAGDKIWSNGAQSGAAEIDESTGKALFPFTNVPGTDVYYNMTGSANQANVPAEQTIENNLGANGDFGYAEVSNGTFTLNHATAYLWFDVAALPSEATLESITVDAGNAAIAGKANWNGEKFTNKTETSGKITLSVNKTSVSADAADITMVVLPVKVESATVTYALTVGGLRKYYEQNLQGCTLAAGNTYSISVDLSAVSLYELRVLTFEDEDAKFARYTLEYCSKEITTWSNLIAANQFSDDLIYSYSQTEDDLYNWVDADNTFLAHRLPYNYSAYAYWGGGHAVSNYASTDYMNADYTVQLTVLGTEGAGGHGGSKNFCMHFGYKDDSGYNFTEELPSIYFGDGEQRVIDHMWVNNSTYQLNCYANGNELTDVIGADDKVWIIATGYDENEQVVGTSEFYLVNGPDGIVKDWTKWDLSELGEVYRVEFNLAGTNDNGYGFSQPAYFAYDDVAVRFEE